MASQGSNALSSIGLLSCPTEVLTMICSNFCKHCREGSDAPATVDKLWPICWDPADIQALYSLSLVSRRLRDVAQPVLYHEFVPGYGVFGQGAPSLVNKSEGYSWRRRLVPFLRTISLRRDLAAMVATCHLNGAIVENEVLNHDDEKEPWRDVLAKACEIRGVELSAFLKCCVEDYKEPFHNQYLVPMLLACLPNVTRLFLSETLLETRASALKLAGVSSIPLRTLVTIGASDSRADAVSSILELASSTINNIIIEAVYDCVVLRKLPVTFSNLRKLSITSFHHSASDIAGFLSCCNSLESFTCMGSCTRYRPHPGPPGALYNSCDLLENLAGCRNTLKFLRLAVPGYGLWKSADSLKEFRVLEYVSLSMDFVEGDDPEGEGGFFALPPSLRVLQLHSICWGYVLDEYGVEELIDDFTLLPLMRWLIQIARAASGGLLPGLASVRCQRPGEIRDDEEIERAKLELDAAFEDYAANMFADTGVEFELLVH